MGDDNKIGRLKWVPTTVFSGGAFRHNVDNIIWFYLWGIWQGYAVTFVDPFKLADNFYVSLLTIFTHYINAFTNNLWINPSYIELNCECLNCVRVLMYYLQEVASHNIVWQYPNTDSIQDDIWWPICNYIKQSIIHQSESRCKGSNCVLMLMYYLKRTLHIIFVTLWQDTIQERTKYNWIWHGVSSTLNWIESLVLKLHPSANTSAARNLQHCVWHILSSTTYGNMIWFDLILIDLLVTEWNSM